MILVTILIFIIMTILIVQLIFYKRQIRDITRQVKEINTETSYKKIFTQMSDKNIENLAIELNRFFDEYRKNKLEKESFEKSLIKSIANMSHDLRTPLTSIIGYLKLLEKDTIEKDEAVHILNEKARKLKILINDFFELAAIETIEDNIILERINVNNILEEEILAVYDMFKQNRITPKINITKESIFIYSLKDIMERILQNLFSNSLKYGKDNVEVVLCGDNGDAVIRISNDCEEITENDVCHMFDRFYMADKVRNDQGSGLGLAIVKSLVEKTNGTVAGKLKNNTVVIECRWTKYK